MGSVNFKSDALFIAVCAFVLISHMKLSDVVLVQAVGSDLNCRPRMQEKIKGLESAGLKSSNL